MKAIFLSASKKNVERVYADEIVAELKTRYEFPDVMIDKSKMERYRDYLSETEIAFSTWGAERFTEDEIRQYFPKLKYVFYAAGSVQGFAKEFLNCGVRVFSAWQANAIPVAEYTYALITLAAKGFFRAERRAKYLFYPSANYAANCGGNYRLKVGIIGVGGIGKLVAEKLKQNDAEVFYYDPFLLTETAERLGVKKSSLEEIFRTCDVITNHLANKEELTGILNGKLFSVMKPYATFINTGRGRQVDEKGLVKAMRKVKTRTAVLDVTLHEPLPPFGRIARRRNIVVTPHIAGSVGREVVRMAKYMLEESKRLEKGETPLYEVTAAMLKTMA